MPWFLSRWFLINVVSPTSHMKGAFLDNTCSLSSAYFQSVLIPVHWSPFDWFDSQFDLLSPRCRLHFCSAFWKENFWDLKFILSASSHPLLAASYRNAVANWSNLDRIGTGNCSGSSCAAVHDKQSLDRISTCFLIHSLPLLYSRT